MTITNILALREDLLLPVNGNDEHWDYISLYNQDGEIIKRSGHHHQEAEIILEYEGLMFVSPRNSRTVFIPFDNLKEFVK